MVHLLSAIDFCLLSCQVTRSLNQVLSTIMDQEASHQFEQEHMGLDDASKTYAVEEFEIRVLEPDKSGIHWETKSTIPMQSSENALTARTVTLLVCLSCFLSPS